MLSVWRWCLFWNVTFNAKQECYVLEFWTYNGTNKQKNVQIAFKLCVYSCKWFTLTLWFTADILCEQCLECHEDMWFYYFFFLLFLLLLFTIYFLIRSSFSFFSLSSVAIASSSSSSPTCLISFAIRSGICHIHHDVCSSVKPFGNAAVILERHCLLCVIIDSSQTVTFAIFWCHLPLALH